MFCNVCKEYLTTHLLIVLICNGWVTKSLTGLNVRLEILRNIKWTSIRFDSSNDFCQTNSPKSKKNITMKLTDKIYHASSSDPNLAEVRQFQLRKKADFEPHKWALKILRKFNQCHLGKVLQTALIH
jgi:hypothetical protein